jgi:hypothetical protein
MFSVIHALAVVFLIAGLFRSITFEAAALRI